MPRRDKEPEFKVTIVFPPPGPESDRALQEYRLLAFETARKLAARTWADTRRVAAGA